MSLKSNTTRLKVTTFEITHEEYMNSDIKTNHSIATVPEHDKIFNEICNKLTGNT